jgi:hypothetical protein
MGHCWFFEMDIIGFIVSHLIWISAFQGFGYY